MFTVIYALRDPRDKCTRYVGKTGQRLVQRLAGHIYDARFGKTRNARWISSLLLQGLRPIIEPLEIVEEGDHWADREAHWINYYLEKGCRLNNHSEGGEGAPGVRHSDETRAKMAAAQRSAWTPERRAKQAEWTGRRNKILKMDWTPERRAALSERNRKNWTPERRASQAVRTGARNKVLKPDWTPDRRVAQAEVARRVNAIRWGKKDQP